MSLRGASNKCVVKLHLPAITTRLKELRLAGTTGQEVRLLIDALSIIRGIKQDRLTV